MLSKAACLLMVVLAVMYANVLHAKIYKWKDADGKWRYSDVQPIDAKDVAQVQYRKRRNDATSKPDDKLESSGKREAVQGEGLTVVEKENLALKQKNCRSAKANLTIYRIGGRIRRVNKAGEMVFLSKKQIAEYAKKAEADVATFCG